MSAADVWPEPRYMRLACSHLRPWRMDSDGWYYRRVTRRVRDAASAWVFGSEGARAVELGGPVMLARGRLYVATEAGVLAANTAVWP